MTASQRVAPISFRHAPVAEHVSCIVPVYNGERFIGEAIQSILAQTYAHREIIVVDDGSEDGTADVLQSLGGQLRVIRQENQGPSLARNRGMEESHGEFVAFLDADDLWVEDKLEAQMEILVERPDVDMCSGHMKSFWVPELEEEARRFSGHPYHQERPVLSACTLLARRELFERIGGFDPDLRNGEDTDWFIRMMRSGATSAIVPRLLLHRRQHLDNLTRKTPPSKERLMTLMKLSLDRDREAAAEQASLREAGRG